VERKFSLLARIWAPAVKASMANVELADVCKSYARQVVLDRASLSVAPGEFVVVMGRSGSGKSTLLKLVGGLDTPDSGSIRHGGRELGAMNDSERTRFRRQTLGFVFQFFNLIPTLTVAENILFPLALNGYSRADAGQRLQELIDELGLGTSGSRFPEELSGGEQQRVAIARALAHRPSLIVADEPTGNLDLETAEQVMQLLTASCRDRGTTLIMATHSREAASFADRIIEIRQGRLTAR
jgi:putative ABC transport system ATP-binding protein